MSSLIIKNWGALKAALVFTTRSYINKPKDRYFTSGKKGLDRAKALLTIAEPLDVSKPQDQLKLMALMSALHKSSSCYLLDSFYSGVISGHGPFNSKIIDAKILTYAAATSKTLYISKHATYWLYDKNKSMGAIISEYHQQLTFADQITMNELVAQYTKQMHPPQPSMFARLFVRKPIKPVEARQKTPADVEEMKPVVK